MRLVTQVVVIAVLAGVGGGWYAWQKWADGRTASDSSRAGRPAGPAAAVDVATIQPGVVTERAEAIGTARANESMTVTAKQAGNVATIVFEEGQRVRANQVLIELESRERRADLDQARAQRDEARQRLERSRQLRPSGNVPEARLDELETQYRAGDARMRMAEARVEDMRITAPFDGRVGLRQVSLGALVQPGTPITTLDDVSRIRLDFSIPEVALDRARPGLIVLARSAAYPTRLFEGTVTVIDTRVDPATRAIRVNAIFDNADDALKPGMFLTVELILSRRENALLVPEEALVAEGTRQYVFLVNNGRVERREVQLGQRLAGEVEVVSGVAAGDTVVVRGVQRIRPGQTVNPRPFAPPTS